MNGTSYAYVKSQRGWEIASSNYFAALDTPTYAGYFSLKNSLYYSINSSTLELNLSKEKLDDTYIDCSYIMYPSNERPIPWADNSQITKVNILCDNSSSSTNRIYPFTMKNWFKGLSGVTVINGLENINTSYVSSLASTFEGCSSLKTLDLKWFMTSSVSDMSSTFKNCSSLQTIYVTERA